MVGAPVRMHLECPQVGERIVDTGGRAIHRIREIVAEVLASQNQMVLNQVEICKTPHTGFGNDREETKVAAAATKLGEVLAETSS